MKWIRKYLISFLLALGILVISALPGDNLPAFSWNFADKVGHVLAYFLLSQAVLIEHWRAIRSSILDGRSLITIWFLCVGYGAIIEILQDQVFIGRHAEWLDITANALGASLAVLVMVFWLRRQNAENS
jgi:VanZ family protein